MHLSSAKLVHPELFDQGEVNMNPPTASALMAMENFLRDHTVLPVVSQGSDGTSFYTYPTSENEVDLEEAINFAEIFDIGKFVLCTLPFVPLNFVSLYFVYRSCNKILTFSYFPL